MNFETLLQRTNAAVLAAFGQQVTLNGVAVQGDVCLRGAQLDFDGVSVAASVPSLVVASANVPADPVGKTVVANAKNYTVVEAMPDGYGLTTLTLELVP
jgi:hypothetical protein